MNCKIVILECNSESHPAICFNLEVARCDTRVVFDENEALNLLEIAQQTGEMFDCLLVNNPSSNRDASRLIERSQRIETEIPIVFVKQSESLKRIVASLARLYPAMNIYFSEPTHIGALVLTLLDNSTSHSENLSIPENRL